MKFNRPMHHAVILAGSLLVASCGFSPALAENRSSTPLSAKEKNDAENAAIRKDWESWNAPFKPFRIIGNLYYVGPVGISSFLITTPEGHILIDTGFEMTV